MGKNYEEDIIRKFRKLIQFYIGLGDSDLILVKVLLSYLQEFIRLYLDVFMVLLYVGYFFMKEIVYMVMVYKNVYVDIGEVFFCISKDGQERVFMEILELCFWFKILWSIDGYWFFEMYLLVIMQMREVFENVSVKELLELVGWLMCVGFLQLCFEGVNWLESCYCICLGFVF